jgi:hypothetical protein
MSRRKSPRRRWPALVLAATLAAASASAEEALSGDEVVARCVAALGGADAWRQVTTLELRGQQSSFSVEKPFLEQRRRPDLYRYESYISTHLNVIGYDGETAWWKRTLEVATKGAWPVAAPLDHARSIAADAELAPPFLEPEARGHRLAFLGATDFDGEPAYDFELTLADGQVEHWYVGADSFLPIARVGDVAYLRMPVERRIYFSDYREAGGIMIPFYVEREFGNEHQILEVEEARVNVDLDPAIFALPPPPGMEKLRPLAGEFAVEVESRRWPGTPTTRTTARSTLRADFHDALLEEDVEMVAAEFPLRLRRQFSYDRFHDVFRVTSFDNATARLDVLEGVFEDGRLTVSDVATGTSWKSYFGDHHSRLTFYEIDADGFTLDAETSADGGETWTLEYRATYQRISP